MVKKNIVLFNLQFQRTFCIFVFRNVKSLDTQTHTKKVIEISVIFKNLNNMLTGTLNFFLLVLVSYSSHYANTVISNLTKYE